jgi:putative ABC transport system substrate-binding protein
VTSIPIVFVGVSDPLDMGLVASLARPGGNMTGISRVFGEGLIGKALQVLKDIVPTPRALRFFGMPAAKSSRVSRKRRRLCACSG